MFPELATDRLILRVHVASDFDALAAQWADPAVVYHIGEVQTREQAWARLLRFVGHWHVLGYGTFAAIDRKTLHYVGSRCTFRSDPIRCADLIGIDANAAFAGSIAGGGADPIERLAR